MARNAAAALLIALVALGAPVLGAPDVAVYVLATGHFELGLVAVGVGDAGFGRVNLQRWDLDVNGCHRNLEADLHFTPKEVRLDVDEETSVAAAFEFRVELFNATGRIVSRTIDEPSGPVATRLATVDDPGPHRVDLYLLRGWDVTWDFRVRGLPAPDEELCSDRVFVNEVEANPAGNDTGNEWLELYNPGIFDANISGWRILALHGVPEVLTVPNGTILVPGAFLVVTFTGGQFLDNSEEVVQIEDPLRGIVDRTPPLTDTKDDGDTNQRVPDGATSWLFRTATSGLTNGT